MSARPSSEPAPMLPADERTLLALIRHLGRTLDDLEAMRVQYANRRDAFERDHEVELPPDLTLAQLEAIEHQAQLDLIRLWRKHPLAPWAKSVRGVGEKSIARLIAEIGDPADRPNVAKLWAYCGYDPNRRHRKGMSQEQALACGNPRAKTRCYLIAESLLKAGVRKTEDGDRYAISPHGELYLARRMHTATTRADWSDGHSHNDALRIVAKEFLKELWRAAH